MKKLLLTALMSSLFINASSYAHHIWIEQEGKKATLQFGEFAENMRETSPGLLDKFVTPTAKLIGQTGDTPLTLAKTPNGFVLSGTANKGESIVVEEATYPAFENTKDGITTRSIWTPAARYISDFTAQQPRLTFDVTPTGKPGEFQVTYKGKPAPKTKINAIVPSGWVKEVTSDDQGLVKFDLPWRGTYVLEGHYIDKNAGERAGQPYHSASFVTSVSFSLKEGIAAVPAGPAGTPNKH